MLKEQDLDILFLVETDSTMIMSEKDYKLRGFKTVFQNKKDGTEKPRIIALCKENVNGLQKLTHRAVLCNEKFASIWMEVKNEKEKNVLVCGYYREWSTVGKKSIESQVDAMKILTRQIDLATLERKPIVMLGDMNMCSTKWKEPNFTWKRIAEEVQGTLLNCGL